MKIRQEQGLTFDDVLLVPKRSAIRSRKQVNTATTLVPGLELSLPILSANMDTVTESEMAIAMARLGGLGIIHRFMSIEHQVSEVRKVKRAENLVVEKPYTISPEMTIASARQLMAESTSGGLLVVDSQGTILGILTKRDVLFEDNDQQKIQNLMTPREKLITALPGTSLEEAKCILHQHRIEKLPLITPEGKIEGLITAKDIIKREQHPLASKDQKGRLRVGAAIGVKKADFERAQALVSAEVDVLVLDIAHGHSDHAISVLKELRTLLGKDVWIIAGNVATSQGVLDLANAGANAIKVGVGAGSICITRVVTGFGVPQLSAILECAQVAKQHRIPIIADGGIRNSGDMAKAIAAGAQTVMLGSLLAGTNESPGKIIQRHGRRYKIIRGMASLGATMSREDVTEELDQVIPEGVEAAVPYRGSVAEILQQMVGGFRSSMSYAGATDIEAFQHNTEFIQITSASLSESKPHDVEFLSS